jgi:hypothetical protein
MPVKTCSNCGGTFPLSEFGVARDRMSGRREICTECKRARDRAYYLANRERILAKALGRSRVREARHCSECGEVLPPDRYRVVCSPRCQERRRYRLNPEAAMEKQRRKRARRKERTA